MNQTMRSYPKRKFIRPVPFYSIRGRIPWQYTMVFSGAQLPSNITPALAAKLETSHDGRFYRWQRLSNVAEAESAGWIKPKLEQLRIHTDPVLGDITQVLMWREVNPNGSWRF